jgi:CheY-like chemotaxis protein
MKVLVIDDDPVVCASMQRLLSDWGCTCLVAGSVSEALVRCHTATRHVDQ